MANCRIHVRHPDDEIRFDKEAYVPYYVVESLSKYECDSEGEPLPGTQEHSLAMDRAVMRAHNLDADLIHSSYFFDRANDGTAAATTTTEAAGPTTATTTEAAAAAEAATMGSETVAIDVREEDEPLFERNQGIPGRYKKCIYDDDIDQFVAISHCWDTADHPDPSGEQLRQLLQELQDAPYVSDPRDTWVFLDYCSLPQRPFATPNEEARFRRCRRRMHMVYCSFRSEFVQLNGSHSFVASDGKVTERKAYTIQYHHFLEKYFRQDHWDDECGVWYCLTALFLGLLFLLGYIPAVIFARCTYRAKHRALQKEWHDSYYRRSWCLFEALVALFSVQAKNAVFDDLTAFARSLRFSSFLRDKLDVLVFQRNRSPAALELDYLMSRELIEAGYCTEEGDQEIVLAMFDEFFLSCINTVWGDCYSLENINRIMIEECARG